MNYFEYDYREEKQTYGAIQIKDLLKLHTRRIRFDTSIGTIILQFLPWRHYVATFNLLGNSPNYRKLQEEVSILMNVNVEDEVMAEHVANLEWEIKRYLDMYSIGCFVDPYISTLNEYDALFRGLKMDERRTLLELLADLTQDVSLEDVDFTVQDIAQAYGVNIIDSEMFENPAKVQIAILTEHHNAKQKELENELHK